MDVEVVNLLQLLVFYAFPILVVGAVLLALAARLSERWRDHEGHDPKR